MLNKSWYKWKSFFIVNKYLFKKTKYKPEQIIFRKLQTNEIILLKLYYILGSVDLKLTNFSDNSQSFLDFDASAALLPSCLSLQSMKYLPVTPSTSVEHARNTLVWQPCLGVLKKPKIILH